MDLSKKLGLLTGSTYDSDAELSGINRGHEIGHVEDTEDEIIDFGLGSLSIDAYLGESGKNKKPKKKKEKKSSFLTILDEVDETKGKKSQTDKLAERTKRLLELADMESADEFDGFLNDDERLDADENIELRNGLLSLGRKYARETAESKEASEITKTFADSEKRLKTLYEELDRDKSSIQKDIEKLRLPSRNSPKTLSEMMSVKNSLHNTQLGIVKEVNSIRKTSYELRAKELARKDAENAGNNDISSNTLRSIFGTVRGGMVNSIGGYGAVSGAHTSDEDDDNIFYSDNGMDDEAIQRKYFSKEDGESSDGDKFLEYEGRGVEYVLLVDDEDRVQEIIAEDKEGIIIHDYPLPSNIDDLTFSIDAGTKSASDNMHRTYKLRRV